MLITHALLSPLRTLASKPTLNLSPILEVIRFCRKALYDDDRLFDELLSLEKRYPEYAASDSPTKRVGSDLDNEFPEVPHRYPMLSLDKVYTERELIEWMEKAGKDLSGPLCFLVEEKVDGSTIVLHYE